MIYCFIILYDYCNFSSFEHRKKVFDTILVFHFYKNTNFIYLILFFIIMQMPIVYVDFI